MTFGPLVLRTLVITVCLAYADNSMAQPTAPNQFSQPADPDSGITGLSWLKISDCLLEVENTLSVPVQQTGVLQALHVKLNEAVEAGQVLAELDKRESNIELELRQKEYALAYEQARDDSDIKYQVNLLRLAETELARFEAIGKSVNASEIDQRRLALEGAKLSVIRIGKAKDRTFLDADRLHVAVKAAELKLQRALIKAPLAGVVSEILQHPGEWVQAGQPLLTICDLEHLVVHAHVPIDQIDRTRLIGSAVQVESTTDHGAPIRLAGTVSSYDHQMTSGGEIRVHAQVQNVMTAGHWQILTGKQVTLLLAFPPKSESFAAPVGQTASR